jgi:regulator of CtrA degradation
MATSLREPDVAAKWVDALYIEAMVLADEARSYFDNQARDDRLALVPADRVALSCESLRVTTRLMHVIAWLLNQRAVRAGELTRAEAATPERRLGEAPPVDAELMPRLPEAAAEIIQASNELYERVRRLDSEPIGEEAPASPARGLLSRLERSL